MSIYGEKYYPNGVPPKGPPPPPLVPSRKEILEREIKRIKKSIKRIEKFGY